MRVDNLGYKPTPSWRRAPEECGIGFWKLLRLYLKKGYGPVAAVKSAWRLRSWEVAVYPHNDTDLSPSDGENPPASNPPN
jgi:hypothetical protein